MPSPAGSEPTGPTAEGRQHDSTADPAEEGQPPEQADERQEPERAGLTDKERRSFEELKREVFGPRCC